MSNTPLDQVLKAKADYESKRQAAITDLLNKRSEIDKQLEALGYEEEGGTKKRRGRRGPMSEATREKMRLAWKRRKEAATKEASGKGKK